MAKRLGSLDYLRALGVVLVVFYHGAKSNGRILGPLSGSGWFGVELFFVLSGFLVTRSLLGSQVGALAFYRKRAWRVLPAYWVTLLLAVVMAFGIGAFDPIVPKQMIRYLPLHLVFLQNYGGVHPVGNLWSLAVEEHVWILLPLVAPWLARAKGRLNPVLMFLVLVGLPMLVRGLTLALHPGAVGGVPTMNSAFGMKIYAPTHAHLDGLALGVWIALYWGELREGVSPRGLMVLAISGAFLVVAVALWTWPWRTFAPRPYAMALGQFTLIAVGFGAILVGTMGLDGGKPAPPAVRWVSERIYSLYLVQGPLMLFFNPLAWAAATLSGVMQWGVLLVYLAATVALGAALYHWVERPGLVRGGWKLEA